jgi:Putative Ig domain
LKTPVRQRPFTISAPIKGNSVLAVGILPALLLALGLHALTGCSGQTSYPTAITITGPASDTIDPGASANFTAVVTGGPLDSGVSWSLTGCTGSNCGTLSNPTNSSVTYTAPTTVTTAFTVTLTAAAITQLTTTQTVTLNVPANPAITTPAGALPGANFGAAYTTSLSATGGITPYTWSITQGALPTGLTINSTTGIISGTSTSAGTASFTVTLADSGSPALQATAAFTLTVAAAVAFQGQVLSGTTPVNGATIQLYAAGATGNMSAAIPMLTQTVLSDGLGMFQLTGSYTCGQSSTGTTIPATAQLYLVATGGTTSTTSTTSNPALSMVTAVGPCTNLTSTSYTLNEITTAAAAWALAPFASSPTTIGASSTNTLGITNAFLDAALLANPATGAPATLPTGLTVEAAKLAALADALSTCATTTCSALFTAATPPSGAAPTDTFTAALNIAHNPGQNVAAIFATIPATPPFPTTLTTSPNDWTMSLAVTGGGLFMPTALGIDTQNNIWVANQDGPLSAFTAQGTPLSSTGYGAGAIAQVYGLAIDPSNNIWVTNYNGGGGGGSVTEFFGVNDPATLGTSTSTTDSICYPTAAAADTNGNIFIANEECSSATILDSTGTAVTPYLGESFGLAAKPLFLAVDTAHGLWLSDNDNTIAHLAPPSTAYPNGQLLSHPDCCYDSHGLALDAQGNVWVANYLNSSFSEVGPDGTVLISQQTLDTSRATPYAAVIDAAQNVWFTSLDSSAILEVAGSSATKPGTELSPSIGVHGQGGFGLDSSLIEPFSLAPDRSGNLWVSSEGQNTLVMFFGLATPTITPLQPVPTAP